MLGFSEQPRCLYGQPLAALVKLREAVRNAYWLREHLAAAGQLGAPGSELHTALVDALDDVTAVRSQLRRIRRLVGGMADVATEEARQLAGPYPGESEEQRAWLRAFNARRFEAFARRIGRAPTTGEKWLEASDEVHISADLEAELRGLLGGDDGED